VIRIWDGHFELYNRENNNGLNATALNAIDLFNRRDITEQQRSQYAASLDREYFVTPKTAQGIPGGVRELVNHGLFPYYAQSSIVAKRNQKRFFPAGLFTYWFSAAAVGCVAAAVLFPALAEAGFGAELALLVAIACCNGGRTERTRTRRGSRTVSSRSAFEAESFRRSVESIRAPWMFCLSWAIRSR